MPKKIPGSPQPKTPPKPESQGLRVDEHLMDPGMYEATEDDTFSVRVPVKQVESRWVIVSEDEPGAVVHEVTFRMWTFDEEVEMRRACLHYDKQRRAHVMNNDLLDRMKVQRLLKKWTFQDDNPRLKIHHVNGAMTDEGWQAFTRLHRNINRHIIDQMNKVLEFNG